MEHLLSTAECQLLGQVLGDGAGEGPAPSLRELAVYRRSEIILVKSCQGATVENEKGSHSKEPGQGR